MNPRTLRHGQHTKVWIMDVATGASDLLYSSDELLLEAANWAPSGESLVMNGGGLLWRVSVTNPGEIEQIEAVGAPQVTNDHVIAPDRTTIYFTGYDGQIWSVPLEGGTATRWTDDSTRFHYLHGVSPDGSEIAFVEIIPGDPTIPGRLALIPSTGGQITYPSDLSKHLDGPEYSADGTWLYFNVEDFGREPGHAQLARMSRVDGEAPRGSVEQLLRSDRVDWFPHLSPDGRWASYISFPAGTIGHPADLDVEVAVVRTDDWTHRIHGVALFGGQGTLNVNSWSPDSTRFAYVSYPFEQ